MIAVLVPFRGGCPYRERAWSWVRCRYEHAGYEIVVGTSDAEGFSRTQAILDARSQSDADVFVIADADVWPEGLDEGVDQAVRHGWSVPNRLIHRLSEASTWRLLAGEDWRDLPLSQDNAQDSKPYRVHEGGTCYIVTAEVFDVAPPDPRFVGWGQEDDALSLTMRTLVGPPWRGAAALVHCWHPAEPRQTRVVGNEPNRQLLRRYKAASRHPDLMHQLVEEGKAWQSTSDPTATGTAKS